MHPSQSTSKEASAKNQQGDQGNQGDNDNISSEVKETHMVVATLIATVSFAAGFTMPGGYQGDKGPDQGFAVLTRNSAFQTFVITNTIAMTLSSCSVMMQLYIFAYGTVKSMTNTFTYVYMCTMLALNAMVIAFITGTYAVLGHSSRLAIVACVLGSVLFFVLTECLAYADNVKGAPHLLPLSILVTIVTIICRLVWQMMRKLFHILKGTVCRLQ